MAGPDEMFRYMSRGFSGYANTDPAKPQDGCVIGTYRDGRLASHCGKPGDVCSIACVHEHAFSHEVCEAHQKAWWWCQVCYAADGHLCRLILTPPLKSFTCPLCGRTSQHPQDVSQGYCGNCHNWTGTGGES